MFRSNALTLLLSCGMMLGMQSPRLELEGERHSQSDLELKGVAGSVPVGQSRFVSRQVLARLSVIETRVMPDDEFRGLPNNGALISGLDMDSLSGKLGAGRDATIVAICKDGYIAPFTPGYRQDHHPILATSIEGLSTEDWGKKSHNEDLGPYFVAYIDFVPSFKVLAHEDRRQVPTQVIRLEYTTEAKLFETIKPRDRYPADSPVMQGYRIAQQNCFRCHASGDLGGRKSQKNWQSIAYMAKTEPDAFAVWVHDPKGVLPGAEMPSNLEYDRATLSALTKYFATLAMD